jgi:hypothetical protein
MKVNELRTLLHMNGGKPSSKRKTRLVSELHELGFSCCPDVSSTTKDTHAIDIASERHLSYRQWMAVKICYLYPEFLVVSNSMTNGRSSLPQSEATLAAGDLEKIYGIVLKGFVTAKDWASTNE